MITLLTNKMIDYYKGDAKRIQHFLKVHAFSKLIGEGEKINEIDMFILESAALVHDIGIREAEKKYNNCSGKYQEELGPAEAECLLRELEYCQEDIDRICYLVGHHHTYDNIEGIDYQILVEADFLVNIYEDALGKAAAKKILDTIFKTHTGRELCVKMFDL